MTKAETSKQLAEELRLAADERREANWKRWGPYLSERQWGTVREDYSKESDAWAAFPHDHARSRAYRWGEDGLLGFTDRECRLCFALALWNGKDPFLKERLFGLSGPEGNHAEDVKELYYYLDATPTHSYMKGLYKYPHNRFPYEQLVEENARRGLQEREFELADTGIFEDDRYFDVLVEYAKSGADNILIQVTVTNRGQIAADLHLLPTFWFRNTWSWGCRHEGCTLKPRMTAEKNGLVRCEHETLGTFICAAETAAPLLFADNETNCELLFRSENTTPWPKDSFHRFVVNAESSAVNDLGYGTKAAWHYAFNLRGGETRIFRLRLSEETTQPASFFGADFQTIVDARREEADEFFAARLPGVCSDDERGVMRQAYAGLLWTKQFYHYIVRDWLEGDPNFPAPPAERKTGRNHDWPHLYNRDVISMPDKWEYPWYAAWDLAFHMLPFSKVDPQFAKDQLMLLLREWYMHPNGQLPAYEWNFSDVNPPVHAWAAWRVYKMTGKRGARDREFLERVFQKLLLNFTWWVNRKDLYGNNLFAGGFLGLDNIGIFDRSKPLPTGGSLQQADGTAWMAFYCLTMLSMSLELAEENPVYEDLASKFFEHFVAICDAMNFLGGSGLWDEADGFYYDHLRVDGSQVPLRTRSMVGLLPLIAVEALEDQQLARFPAFKKRLQWFLNNRRDLARHVSFLETSAHGDHRLLAVTSEEKLVKVLRYLLDESEFLSPFGIRSVSKVHEKHPSTFVADGVIYQVDYVPGEGNTRLFGGNSNWRGPIWFPINFLIVEALERFHHFYGDRLRVECPVGSGRMLNLKQAANEIARRLTSLFAFDSEGHRPCHGGETRYDKAGPWSDLVLFHEYFHAETGRGLGASHQTGWTALAVNLVQMAHEDQQHKAVISGDSHDQWRTHDREGVAA